LNKGFILKEKDYVSVFFFVVVIHTQVPPVNDGLIELFALLDAINNARPADVLLVFPYMP